MVSGNLAQAAADRRRNELLGIALDVFEAEDGLFTREELAAASHALSVPRSAGET